MSLVYCVDKTCVGLNAMWNRCLVVRCVCSPLLPAERLPFTIPPSGQATNLSEGHQHWQPCPPPPLLFLSLLSLSHHFFPSSRDSWFFLYHSFCNSSCRPLPDPFCSSFPSTMSIRSLLCASPSAETFGLLTPCFSRLSSTHSTVAPARSLALWV